MRLFQTHVQATYGSVILSQTTGLLTEDEVVEAIETTWLNAFNQLKRRGVFDWKQNGKSSPMMGFDFTVYARPTQ